MIETYTTEKETYVVIRQIAEGDQGAVYLTQTESTGVPVVVKRLYAEYLYEQERAVLAQITYLKIQGIPWLLDFSDASMALVMEYIDGPNVAAIPKKLLPLRVVIDGITHLFTILVQLHQDGIVHGDLQEKHLILGNDGQIHLVDFGAAEMAHRSSREYQDVCNMVMAAHALRDLATEQESRLTTWLDDAFVRVTSEREDATAASVLAGWQDLLKERDAR